MPGPHFLHQYELHSMKKMRLRPLLTKEAARNGKNCVKSPSLAILRPLMAEPLSSHDCYGMGFLYNVGGGYLGHIFTQNVVHISGETERKQPKLVCIESNRYFWPF